MTVMDGPSWLPPIRAGRPPSSELVERRLAYRDILGAIGEDPPLARCAETIGGVDCLVVAPPAARATVVYFHGGAYRAGSPEMVAPFSSRIAARLGVRVVSARYPLAPEHPYPSALHAGAALWEALTEQSGSPLIAMGDSAGGGLTLAVAVALIANGRANAGLAGMILISPWLDLSLSFPSYVRCAGTDRLFRPQSAAQAADEYLQGEPPSSPLASPLFADHEGLPPVLQFVGTSEILIDENLALAASLAAAHVSVELHVVPHGQHIWPILRFGTPEAETTIGTICRFADRILQQDGRHPEVR